VYGVTTLDIVRANTFVSESQGWAPKDTDVTVVGGHAGYTILPLLSQVKGAKLSQEQIEALTKRIQFGGDEVVQVRGDATGGGGGSAVVSDRSWWAGRRVGGRPLARSCEGDGAAHRHYLRRHFTPAPPPPPPQAKDGAGSATLSMAFAADRFVASLLRGLRGEKGVTECAFVESPIVPGLPFFSTRVELTPSGVGKIHPIGALSPFEEAGLAKAVPELKASIAKGVEFAAKWTPK
jgi:malate dehydrogenase